MPDAAPRLVPPIKLHPPACPRDLVVRHRLLDRLDEATRGRCTLIAAGPGYGKSVLLASWVAQQNTFTRVSWLTLESADAGPERFVAHLVAALQEPFRSSSAPPTALMDLRPPPMPSDLGFFEDAFLLALDQVEEPLVLVIDDAHHVSSSPTAIAGLDMLLRWAPPNLRMIISGRFDPPVSLQRLRLAGQLTTLRQRELACTLEESQAVLRSSGLQLGSAETRAVHEFTQGWAAALRLAALSLLDLGTAPAFLERFLGRDVALADYLTSEVLQGLPAALHDFVLRATVDRMVCGRLVEEVSGVSDGDAMLRECERRNLFLTRVSHDGQDWYAWHQMFADQMQRRLEAEDHDAASAAHIVAARWWSTIDVGRATRHALAGGDVSLAVEVVADSWLPVALAGESENLLDLVSLLPAESEYEADLRLAACYAHLLQAEQRAATGDLLKAMAARSRLPEAVRWRFDARAAWLRMLLTDQHTLLAEVLRDARAVLDAAPTEAIFDDTDPTYALAVLAVGMGEGRVQDDIPAAIGLLRGAVEVGRRNGLDVLALMARAELCTPLVHEGDLAAIEREAKSLVDEADRRGWQSFGPVAQPLGYLGWLGFWRGDLAEARRHLERALKICPPSDWQMGVTTYFHARVALAHGELETAESDLAKAWLLAEAGCMPPTGESLLVGLQAEVAAAQGDIAGALGFLDSAPGPEHRMTVATHAALTRRGGDALAALSLADRLVDPYPNVGVLREMLRALAFQDLSQVEESHVAFESALALAEPASLMGPFLRESDAVGSLLDAHIRRGTAHPNFATLLAQKLSGSVDQRVTGRHERLTDREQNVLHYLRTSMPNAEIAAQMFVSINTVKTHAASIYRKLGVSGRREAVHRADEIGLFGFNTTEQPPQRTASGGSTRGA